MKKHNAQVQIILYDFNNNNLRIIMKCVSIPMLLNQTNIILYE